MPSHLTDTLPTTWDDARDGAFFRMTADLFGASFTAGAGVLLASYDDEDAALATPAPPSADVRSPLPAAATAV